MTSLSVAFFTFMGLFLCAFQHNLYSNEKLDKSHWPKPSEWESLRDSVEGRLIQVLSPFDCIMSPPPQNELRNPFAIQEFPWGMEAEGWLNAWRLEASPYAVAAKNTGDIVATVKFAKKHQLKLTIKGTGHDYLGRSNGSFDSLLLWTHPMRKVIIHEAFVPTGAPSSEKGIPAVIVEAGARWLEVYREVMVKHGRYVQGGGCTSVGVAGGFLQGGGFGSFSKKYGVAAGSLIEAEIVVASGELLIVNEFQNKDLFWALKGGGGGTFGVVSKVVLQTHELPKYLGTLNGKIIARSDAAFEHLIEEFILFYRKNLNNEHWGEQVTLKPDNSLHLHLTFQGLNQIEAEKIWSPFKNWIDEHSSLYKTDLNFLVVPGKDAWSHEYLAAKIPEAIISYQEGKNGLFHWSGDQSQVMAYWYTMQSRWLPFVLFEKDPAFLAKILFKASREWAFALHFNKGLSGSSKEAMERSQKTSINPIVLDSAALVIFGAFQPQSLFEVSKDKQAGMQEIQRINAAMKIIAEATPCSGAYSNEADYFQTNWQQAFWGDNYSRLLEIKKKYDPENFFKGHHSVGSEL